MSAQRSPQQLFSWSSLPPTPIRRQDDDHDETSTPLKSTPTIAKNGSALANTMMKTALTSDEILDESFATATTEATTYISDVSMQHSPFSLMETSCDVSDDFLRHSDSKWKLLPLSRLRDDSPPKALFARSVTTSSAFRSSNDSPLSSLHSHIQTTSLEFDSFGDFRCPSPSYEQSSSRRSSKAKRRTIPRKQHHHEPIVAMESNMTPVGIAERRRFFRQTSAFTDKGRAVVTPTSSSEGRSSPELEDDSGKPIATSRRLRRNGTRPQVFLSESDLLLRQPLAHIQLTTRRLRTNGLIGMLCLVGFCFMGMIFVTNRIFFLFEDQRLPGMKRREQSWRRRRITTFQPDSLLVNGGLRGVVSYATSWKRGTPSTQIDQAQRVVVQGKLKPKIKTRHNSVLQKKKAVVNRRSQLLENKPQNTIVAELEAEQTVARGVGIVIPPPTKLWITKKAKFDLLDVQMYRRPAKEIKPHSMAPRVVFLDGPWTSTGALSSRVEEYPAEFSDNTQLYSILDSSDERLQHMELREPFVQGECVPMQDWQTTFHPSCNGMHELGMENMGEEEDVYKVELFGTKGYWRYAWKFESQSNFSETKSRDTFVVKTLKFQHDFEEAHFEHSRIDAVAMERLTASPHVINIFGFCGHSVLTEYADGKRVGELADKMKRAPLARLRIARDIANGLADVHGIDGDGNATFVHFDVNLANVVSIGDTLKLNDFNIGIIRRWNTTSNTPCGFPAQYPNPQWRSPEEARNEQNLTEKVDVFSMGHIFFRLICGHEPWNKLEVGGKPSKEIITEKVQKGVLPFILPEVMRTTDKEVAAIREAMLQCYTFDPTKRPSARDIARQLENALATLSKEQQLSLE